MVKNNEKPNIIFIHAESMDGRKMGCMGAKPLENATPNLDQLAKEGILFNNAYANNPVCNPSRASMWTGTYPHHHQCWNNHEGITDDVPILTDRLEEMGYNTKKIGPLDYTYGKHSIRDRVGSWTRAANIHRALVSSSLPQIHEEKSIYDRDRDHIQKGIDWLKNNKNDNPFMLYITTGLVHPAFNATQEFVEMINEDQIDIPPADKEKHPVLDYIKATKNSNQDCPDSMIKKIRKVYFAMIATLDDMLGDLFASVKKLGLDKNTYIIFSSDHGEMAMEHDQILKRTMYEPSIRVPLIINGPDLAENKKIETPVSLVDLFPTIMDMAGRSHPRNLAGESLFSLCKNEKNNNHRDWVFAEYHGDRCNTGTFMLRKGNWKYINYAGYRPQLFNLKEDPWEVNNLATDKPDKITEMEKLLSKIVDYKEIDARAKQYDKENFRKWRIEQKEKGTYEDKMAYIYSGYDNVQVEDLKKWSETDEILIQRWLDE